MPREQRIVDLRSPAEIPELAVTTPKSRAIIDQYQELVDQQLARPRPTGLTVTTPRPTAADLHMFREHLHGQPVPTALDAAVDVTLNFSVLSVTWMGALVLFAIFMLYRWFTV
jgi:hypothetical protein